MRQPVQQHPAKLLECVRVEGVTEHLGAFQAIADDNDGNRADQTPGYQASVDYVVETLEAAGWSAEVEEFTYPGVNTSLQVTGASGPWSPAPSPAAVKGP